MVHFFFGKRFFLEKKFPTKTIKCAAVHSGQFILGLAELSLSFSKKVLLDTSDLTLLPRWNNEPHVQKERDWFDVIINSFRKQVFIIF